MKTCYKNIPENETFRLDNKLINVTTDLITLRDLYEPPYVSWDTNNQFCGSLQNIIVELSIRKNYNLLRLPDPGNLLDTVQMINNPTFSFLIYPTTQSDIESTLNSPVVKAMNITFELSRIIGYKAEGLILSIVKPGKRNIFEFISGFESQVWIAIVLSLFMIPITFSIIDRSFSKFRDDVWKYSFILLSEPVPQIPNNNLKRLLISLWLLSCTVILSAYAGTLRGFLIKSVPNIIIDSWEDLFNRKELRIATDSLSYIKNYAEMYSNFSPMAENFHERIDEFEGPDHPLLNEYYKKAIEGKHVIAAKNTFIHEFDRYCSEILCECKCVHLSHLHISRFAAGFSPYFVPMFGSNAKLKLQFNQLVVQLTENGVFDKWTEYSRLNTKFSEMKNYETSEYESTDLSFYRLYGPFISWLSGILFSFNIYLIEIISHKLTHNSINRHSVRHNRQGMHFQRAFYKHCADTVLVGTL